MLLSVTLLLVLSMIYNEESGAAAVVAFVIVNWSFWVSVGDVQTHCIRPSVISSLHPLGRLVKTAINVVGECTVQQARDHHFDVARRSSMCAVRLGPPSLVVEWCSGPPSSGVCEMAVSGCCQVPRMGSFPGLPSAGVSRMAVSRWCQAVVWAVPQDRRLPMFDQTMMRCSAIGLISKTATLRSTRGGGLRVISCAGGWLLD